MRHLSKFGHYCVALTITAGLSGCIPVVPPADQASSTGGSGMAQPENSTPTPKPTAAARPAPPPMSQQEKEAVAALQWLNNADALADARKEISQARFQGGKPALMVFAQRGLSYPGLNRAQLKSIRRKVNDKIATGSGDVIFGETHHAMLRKLRIYAVTYNQAILAAVQ